MQESRLFKILYYLLDKGQATAPELAQRFEVSVRTIYRDIDALSGAGIPIYAETGRNGGIHLVNDFVLNKAMFSQQEKQEILTALNNLAVLHGDKENSTLHKLSAIFNVPSDSWIEIDLARWGQKENDNKKFAMLKSAIVHRRVLRFSYAGASRELTLRTVKPIKLLFKSTAWYLKAYCIEKDDFRVFRLTRMLDVEMLEDTFPPMAYAQGEDTSPLTCGQVVLRFKKEMAYRVYDEFDLKLITALENGDLITKAEMPQDARVVGFILSFGTQVEIISPKELKEAVAEAAKEIYETHKP